MNKVKRFPERPSRQYRWQLKKMAQGLCNICGKKKIYCSGRCKEHYKLHMIRQRLWARKKNKAKRHNKCKWV